MTIIPRLRRIALARQRGRCYYCKDLLAAEHATADHMWPGCRRGRTYVGNIAAACLPCNHAKGNMSHIEFFKLIDRRKLPAGASMKVIMIWSARRIWKRTRRACANIRRRSV